MAKKRAGALGHRKGVTWSTYVAKVPPVVTPGPYDISAPPATPPAAVSPFDITGGGS